MDEQTSGWTHRVYDDPDGTCRVEVVDEDGVAYPVVRKVTREQAARLVRAIGMEAQTARRLVKNVIRDPEFMAGTVLAIKQIHP
jgi:hypothetical protein